MTSPISNDNLSSPALSVWNPGDHIRLLWWAFVFPNRLSAYRKTHGERSERRVGAWLASTLTWLPTFLVSLAAGIGMLPARMGGFPPSVFLWFSAVLILIWALTGWLGSRANETKSCSVSFVALNVVVLFAVMAFVTGRSLDDATGVEQFARSAMVAIAIALALSALPAHLVPGGVPQFIAAAGAACAATIVGGFLSFVGVFFITSLLAYPLERIVENSYQTGRPSTLARGALGAMILGYAFLIGFSFLGGWHVFR